MASRQLPESRNHQTWTIRVKGKTGKAQSVGPASQASHRVEMAADVQETRSWWWLGSMTEPELTKPLGRALGQPIDPGVTVMVAANEQHLAVAQLRK